MGFHHLLTNGISFPLKLEDDEGFDVAEGVYCNMVDAGIIDPTKVVRSALQDAGSIASLLITTEAMIADIPQSDDGWPV